MSQTSKGDTYNDIVRSTRPLDWRRMLAELSWTPEQILSGERTIVPTWDKVKKLLEEHG